MHKAPLPALLLVTLLIGPSVRAADPPRPSSELVREAITRLTTVEWPRASARGDVQWFEHHFADELLMTNGQTGEVTTKAQELASVRPAEEGNSTGKIEHLRVNVYDGMAVTAFEVHVSGPDGTRPYHRIVPYTEVWVSRDGRWQLAASHSSPLPQRGCEPHAGFPEGH